MNVERLTEIAEWLEAGAPEKGGVVGFDMRDFSRETPCGSVCCIAGAAAEWFGERQDYWCTDVSAREILGLPDDLGDELFFPFETLEKAGVDTDLEEITPSWAARCIRKLIATGEVDWLGTREEA